MTGEPVMSTALVRREQPAGGAGRPRCWRRGAAADGADERCFGPFEAKLREGAR
jgi:hypothetical protein